MFGVRKGFWWFGELVAIWLICLPQAKLGFGDTFYVNNRTGNDGNSGRASSFDIQGGGPKRTVRQAFRGALPGDTIVLLPTEEPYREEIALAGAHTGGLPDRPITIEGNGVLLQGSNLIQAEWWRPRGEGYYLLDGFSTGVRDLFIEGTRVPVSHAGWTTPLPQLEPGAARYWRGTILLRTADRAAPGDRVAVSQRRCGVFIDRAARVIVRDLRIQGFWIDGAQVRGPAAIVRFENCRFSGNGRSGATVANNARVEFANCAFDDNGQAGIRVTGFSKARLLDTEIDEAALVADPTCEIQTPASAPDG